MDPFLSLWGEANEVVGPAGSMGRVVAHVVRTLVLDLFANYRFCSSTRRLVKSPVEIKVRGACRTRLCRDDNQAIGVPGVAMIDAAMYCNAFHDRPIFGKLMRALFSCLGRCWTWMSPPQLAMRKWGEV